LCASTAYLARMIDDIEFLDDATRPKAPKLDGLTPAQRAPGLHLKEIHDHLRGNMAMLRGLIDQASTGEIGSAEVDAQTAGLAMVANFRRFGTLCGHHCQFVHGHHSIEDAHLFPALAAKSEAFRKVTDRLQAEHVVVHELLMRLIDALHQLADEPSRESFESATAIYDALERVLLSHLGYEEDEIGDAIGYFGLF
jgi:hemerythrin-like domain-containing protein